MTADNVWPSGAVVDVPLEIGWQSLRRRLEQGLRCWLILGSYSDNVLGGRKVLLGQEAYAAAALLGATYFTAWRGLRYGSGVFFDYIKQEDAPEGAQGKRDELLGLAQAASPLLRGKKPALIQLYSADEVARAMQLPEPGPLARISLAEAVVPVKLRQHIIRAYLELFEERPSVLELARMLGMSESTVRRYLAGM